MDVLSGLTQPQAVLAAGVLAAFVAVVGTLATNLVTHLITVKGQYRRRWDERRMEIYAEYARSVKRITFLSARVAAARGLPYELAPLDPDEGLPALAAAEEERAARWEPVLLLGDTDVVKAARAWHHEAWHMVEFANGRFTDVAEWNKTIDAMDNARAAFYRVARRDLAVGKGDIPPQAWPPSWLAERPADLRT
jgi:hypothetical protein